MLCQKITPVITIITAKAAIVNTLWFEADLKYFSINTAFERGQPQRK
jgi:hypothetical protein